ncbi:MAG TPA: glycosyltransferase family 9 protein [Flavisolibacter sp.]|nr:glycosyltransferase family 9 protein [Flavisolibacter sp.]
MSSKILVRLPNWLGDMVMSVGFINQLSHFFPDAEISVIAKKGIHQLLPFFPATKHQFIFSKHEYKGIKGLLKFGREIKATEHFDFFFSLPNSFSTALGGFATGATKRVGYKKELRQFLLTNSYSIPKGMHRVEEYIRLLELYTGKPRTDIRVLLQHNFQKKDHVVVNINSEASSRRLTEEKAIEFINAIRNQIVNPILLIGAPNEKTFVETVLQKLNDKTNIASVAGTTTLPQLGELLATAQLLFTTDSGPAHLANALGTHTFVLFGAGNENKTAPYNKNERTIVRLGELSCEPCEKNICVRYGIPQCLELLNTEHISNKIKQLVNG